MGVTRLFLSDEMDDLARAIFEARRLVMRHDDAFYGPMKGCKCGCNECKWARRYIALADSILTGRGRTEEPSETATAERCPDDGRYGVAAHEVVDGHCYTCAGEEAARRARLEEKGIFFGR